MAEAPPSAPLTLLLVTDRPALVSTLAEKLEPRWTTLLCTDESKIGDALRADLVLVDVPRENHGALERALDAPGRFGDSLTAVLALDGGLSREERTALYRAGVLACVSLEEDPDELAAHLLSLVSAKRPAAEALRRLRNHTRHLDEQLRLAQRLQMDFLPRRVPAVEGARFAARLEPAAWVAGDFYDIFRLDERHVGFYIADAVGHGMPAALLTVFVKKSLQTKRIEGKHYELIWPDEALRLLNADLLSAELQQTPFITMVYGLYNEVTCECVYARAGHPRPLVVKADGALEELDAEGALLGIFPHATFEAHRRRLEPGERLILYSDGAERVEADSPANVKRLFEIIRSHALLPAEAMLDAILEAVHTAAGGGRLADDVTLVALDVEPDGHDAG